VPETTAHNPNTTQASPTPALTTDHEAALNQYISELERQPDLSKHTRVAYVAALRRFLLWMDDELTEPSWEGDPLTDGTARRHAVIDFRQAALTGKVRGRDGTSFVSLKEGTVKATLAGLSDFYIRRGLGAISSKEVKRPIPPRRAPKALRGKTRVRWDRTVDGLTSARDKAVLGLMRHGGLRREEVVALDLDDITLSARKGSVRVYGKGGKVRRVPANVQLRELVQEWLTNRRTWPGSDETTALFIAARKPIRRLGVRHINDLVAAVAEEANLGDDITVTPHTLRHTFATELLRDEDVDIVTVADLLGHSSIETTRLYAAASDDDLQAAVDQISSTHLR
jgi:site-specific recombinase XerD